jgi:plastocyanin
MRRLIFPAAVLFTLVLMPGSVSAGDASGNYYVPSTTQPRVAGGNGAAAAACSSSTATLAVQLINTIDMIPCAFNPPAIQVETGETIVFTNQDSTSVHAVASDTPGGPSSGGIAPHQKYTATINSPGLYNYHDPTHPSMTGSIVVTARTVVGGVVAGPNGVATYTTPVPATTTPAATEKTTVPSTYSTTVTPTAPQTIPSVGSKVTPAGIGMLFIISGLIGAVAYRIYLTRRLT